MEDLKENFMIYWSWIDTMNNFTWFQRWLWTRESELFHVNGNYHSRPITVQSQAEIKLYRHWSSIFSVDFQQVFDDSKVATETYSKITKKTICKCVTEAWSEKCHRKIQFFFKQKFFKGMGSNLNWLKLIIKTPEWHFPGDK